MFFIFITICVTIFFFIFIYSFLLHFLGDKLNIKVTKIILILLFFVVISLEITRLVKINLEIMSGNYEGEFLTEEEAKTTNYKIELVKDEIFKIEKIGSYREFDFISTEEKGTDYFLSYTEENGEKVLVNLEKRFNYELIETDDINKVNKIFRIENKTQKRKVFGKNIYRKTSFQYKIYINKK